MVRVLFVCLGNICRSPMAEGIFSHLVEDAGLNNQFKIDSCGTSGFHSGEPADHRMQQTAQAHGVRLLSKSRALVASDFTDFDYILPMDSHNHEDILIAQKRVSGSTAVVKKMLDFDDQNQGGDVPDPYYGGADGFEQVYQMLWRSSHKLLSHLRQAHKL